MLKVAPAPPTMGAPCATAGRDASRPPPTPASPVPAPLGDGELPARSRYVEWAMRMERTWGLDVLTCSTCGRKMRVLATITDPTVVRRILDHLGVRSSPLPRAPPRDPAWEQTELGFVAA